MGRSGLPDPTPEVPLGNTGGDNSVKNANAGISEPPSGNEVAGQICPC